MKKEIILPAVIAAAVMGGVGFFGGMKYGESKTVIPTRQVNGQRQGNGGSRMGFRPLTGEVINSDDTSVTIKLTDGSSKIIVLTDKTVFNKADIATKADLKTGIKIAVFGQENSGGSVNAQSIQLNPIAR